MPVFYTIASLGILMILKRFSFTNLKKDSLILCAFIFIIFQIQPSMISTIISGLSCRKIGIKSYIMSDVSYECLSTVHIFFILFFLIPSLFIWVVTIPLVVFRKIWNER